MKFVDLTHTFVQGMPVYPGDPTPEMTPIAALVKDGYVDHQIKTGMHVGTHMDAPLHMIEGGKRLSEFPVEKFCGNGVLIDARGKNEIGTALLERVSVKPGDILLVLTGHDKKFSSPEYYQSYPEVSEAFAREIIQRGVKMLGLDAPSPDRPPFVIHKLLLAREILLIENLTNLETLLAVARFEVFALPAKFEADGAPARAVAKIYR